MRHPALPILLATVTLAACAPRGPARPVTAGPPAPAGSSTAGAAEPSSPRARSGGARERDLVARLALALERRLSRGLGREGTTVYPTHCQDAPGGCPARLRAFARILAEAGARHGIDPFLLAGMAMRESSFDPSARGRLGEAGIVQLHPRGEGHDVRFVQDAAFRRRCLGQPDACQGPVVERAAEALARSQQVCGSMTRALARYASGRCDRGLSRVYRVLEERDRLRQAAAETGEP